ncbi:F5/8 type C domain protein [compost metagenome]
MKLRRQKSMLVMLSMVLSATIIGTGFGGNVPHANAAADSEITLSASPSDMPANFRSSVEWVYQNRMLVENSVGRKNLIFDQIFAGKGTLNYVVRWQSERNVTLQQRQDMEKMLHRQVNNWTKHLQGYDGWPYGDIPVKIVGWAVANPAQILNKQPNEKVYTETTIDDMSKSDPRIPALLPHAPRELSRFDNFTNPNYAYPGGLDKRFDMYLWATANFGYGGGHGGDWGQRMEDRYILDTLNDHEISTTEHEIGHGFGFPDFYNPQDRPPGGFPDRTIMWAFDSEVITNWDVWLLRHTWSQLKKDTNRFPLNQGQPQQPINVAAKATASSSYVSPWESITALNDGFDPTHSNDRTHAVYGNWPETGTHWVQYDLDRTYTLSQTDVYWFKDNGGIDVPESYKVQYWDGQGWADVKGAAGLGTLPDAYNTTTFDPIRTSKIRLQLLSNSPASTGILEWKVIGTVD